MSTIVSSMSIEEATSLIKGVGGHAPEAEANELYKFSSLEERLFDNLVQRRLEHEPTAYITKHSKFRDLNLYIDERVLVPRSETEPLVEIAVENAMASVLDVGTGSGAVALAVKNERPDLEVLGVDISKDALDIASINSATLDLDVDWHEHDLIEGVEDEYECVLANLPYLPTTKKDSYEPEMVEHEPQVALWGGTDGFDLTRRLLTLAGPRKGVHLIALELGLGQESVVTELVRAAGFKTVFCVADAKGDIRACVGKR